MGRLIDADKLLETLQDLEPHCENKDYEWGNIKWKWGVSMTESEAVEKLKNMRLFMQIEDENNDCKFTEDDYKANEMAIQALEKQEKIKEAFEMWKTETGGGVDER